MPTPLSLAPIRRAIGTVTIPGSKSISNRALLLASLAEGTTRLQRFLECDDPHHDRKRSGLVRGRRRY
ncbi:hypothetical protein [Cupriavidus sp. CP313]